MSSRPVIAAEQAASGFFGKIPRLGDFVSRGLAHGCITEIDSWLQLGMTRAREEQPDWRASYGRTPVWRFLLPRGQWGDTALAGVLIASIDRVGRHFPLVACMSAAAAPEPAAPPRAAAGAEQLARILPPMMNQLQSPEMMLQEIQRCARDGAGAHPPLPAVLQMFAAEGSRSVWWSVRHPEQPFLEFAHRGKPDAGLFLRLLGH